MKDLPFPEESPLNKDIDLISNYYVTDEVKKESFNAAIHKLFNEHEERTPSGQGSNSGGVGTAADILITGHSQMDTSLRAVTDSISSYLENKDVDGDTLCGLLQTVSAHMYFLEVFRAGYHQKWNGIVHAFPGAVSRAEIEAHEQVPELYMLRRIMGAANKAMDAMRSQLSAMKHELTNSK
jgi:hypothetical protein